MSARTRILPIPMGVGPSPSEFYTKTEIDTMLLEYAKLVTTDLVNYYLKTETYTQAEVQQLVGQITSFEVVATLPQSDIKTNVIYLLGPSGSGADKYDEYIYSNNTWVKIGETSIDLSNYITVNQLNTALGFYTPTQQLATVATSGLYSDLSGTPTLSTVATSGAYSDLTGTPTLATVATSGSYNDLTDKPTIPVVPTLATVATSGSYNDLTDKPTIPTVGTGVVTLTQGGTTIGTFGLNDDTDKTIDIPGGGSTEEIEEAIAAAINDTRDTINQDLHNNYVRTQTMNDQLRNYTPKASMNSYYDKTQVDTAIGTINGEIEDKEKTVSYAINDLEENKQDKLMAGSGITIGTDNTISAIGTGTVALTFTLDNLSTVTYNVVIN